MTTMKDLEKMTNQELLETQENALAILRCFNYDIENDKIIRAISLKVDTATTEEKCHHAYLLYVYMLSDKAEEIFYENRSITVNELASLLKVNA